MRSYGLLGVWCEMEFVRFASATGPDARRRDAVDAVVSARRGNAADGSTPPQSVRTEFYTRLLEGDRSWLVFRIG